MEELITLFAQIMYDYILCVCMGVLRRYSTWPGILCILYCNMRWLMILLKTHLQTIFSSILSYSGVLIKQVYIFFSILNSFISFVSNIFKHYEKGFLFVVFYWIIAKYRVLLWMFVKFFGSVYDHCTDMLREDAGPPG